MAAAASPPIVDWSQTPDISIPADMLDGYARYAETLASDLDAGKPHPFIKHAAVLLEKAVLVMGHRFRGVGADIGAGSGAVTALISREPEVARVYAVEPSVQMVERVMPATFRVLDADTSKIVRVIGSFHRLQFPDQSLDFIVAVAALHHASDLAGAIAEMHRVLKLGGWALVLDRWQPDSLTEEEIQRSVDAELPDEVSQQYGCPPGTRLTRREFGEHEIRLCEWKTDFLRAGFDIYPFALYAYGGRWVTRLLSAATTLFFRWFGDRLLARRQWHVRGFSYPVDAGWLGERGPFLSTNLIMACRKRPPAARKT